MNKREFEKLHKKFEERHLNARQSCIYCVNWGFGCANGHPAVYPNDRSDYLIFCKGIMDACKYLAKQLKREGISLSRWEFTETPAKDVYVFYNKRKLKDITVIYDPEKSEYLIASTDMYWRYSNEYNVYVHNSVKEALNVPWQHWNFIYTNLDNQNRKKRIRAIEKIRRNNWR